MKKLLLLAGVLAASVVASSAQAITYGQPDENRHPYVGALVGTFASGTFPYCSGTLISPTVFLTAAHCDVGESTVCVTFDEVYTAASPLYCGTFYAHPDFSHRQSNPNDVAVIVFSSPIQGIQPAALPELGLLGGMKAAHTLNQSTAFTSVGYGAQETSKGPGGHDLVYLDRREFAVGYFNALGPGYLRISQNPATGSGGTCYGDSGGGIFLGGPESDLLVAVTVTGDTFCKSTNVVQRLDIPSVQSFLAQFVTLP